MEAMTTVADSPATRLLAEVETHRSDMLALLTDLVEIESPSTEPRRLDPIFNRLTAELEHRGMRTRRVRGHRTGGYLFAVPRRRRTHDPVQLLVGHADTVWPSGTLEERPVVMGNGTVHGPGTYDMKAGLVQMLFAVEALNSLDRRAPADPVLLINSDEEIGSRESSSAIDRLARIACRAFIMEPGLGPDGKLKTARKGLGRFTVAVEGKAAHAGLDPDKGVSAILELSIVIQKLFALNDPERGITVNVGTIEGGMRANVVAPTSEAVVDVRVLRHEDAVRIERAIRALEPSTPGTSLHVTGRFGRPPMERTPGNVELFLAAQRIGAELGVELDESTAGGGSDGNTTSQRTPTLDGLGPIGDGAHAPHEQVSIDSIVRRSALLAALMMEPIDDRVEGRAS
jgi:glutamate carboxypeptidase